ncbi:Zn-dependent protease with chaperone function [Polaromonas sp. CF318]|uniref:M48 family metallopeptidase n=1 Tax=Polaromonas sp. CF318 TaxID=1144318 RepID=UPI00027134F5|nr:M48 family metallopeptidase [Polaromonas sp. CF318]EJL89910.1 Zn-dependent protease with chaperone function [Polaromonas sp. CF318]
MDRADFIHLVRLSEHASADDSKAYRRSVAAFAALGYAWVVGCLLLSAGILAWVASAMMHGRIKGFYVALVVAAGGLLWTSLRALWCRFDEPEGVVLQPADAPALFEALERIRRKIKGPPIHCVRLDADFNASIRQHPRFGLFGGGVNHLNIGLPLLMALDRPRFLAVLAHEYGHLRGDHGRFAAWIYRTRLSWAMLNHGLRNDEGPVAAATQAFLRWYFPRFSAKTFALARQDEYEADRISGKLLGKDVAAAALTELAVKGDWVAREFWLEHWSAAAAQALPVGPYAAMRPLLGLAPPGDFARESLRQALRRISDVDDTHPGLRDRLEALKAGKNLPAWSASSRSALALLGDGGAKWIAHFDKQWCRDNASDWKQHHAYLGRVRARADALASSEKRNNAEEMVELGNLRRRLDARADVRGHYERALQMTPGHAGALRGLAQCLPAAERALRLDCLGQLFEHSVASRWWACRVAVAEMEQPAVDGSFDEKALALWRERLKQAEEAEGRAWEELTDTPFFQAIGRHDLSLFEHGELQAQLARCKPVARAWLVRKNLKEFAHRRCYLLFLDLPGLDDESRYALCRDLERSLDLPGPVLVLWAGYSPTLGDIERNAFEAVYLRAMD